MRIIELSVLHSLDYYPYCVTDPTTSNNDSITVFLIFSTNYQNNIYPNNASERVLLIYCEVKSNIEFKDA